MRTVKPQILQNFLADNDILFAIYGPLTPLIAKKDGSVTHSLNPWPKSTERHQLRSESQTLEADFVDSFAIFVSSI